MKSAPTPSESILIGNERFDWRSFAIALGFLLFVAVLDVSKPFNGSWSILYLLVAGYAGWALRGTAERIFLTISTLTVYLAPLLFNPVMLQGNRWVHRTTGVIAGFIVLFFMWERRRYTTALQTANLELEQKVAERTAELQSSNQRLENLSRELITTQESERRHFARELHDEIGQVLTAIKMNLRRTRQMAECSLHAALDDNVRLVDQAICQTRNLSNSLRPPQLDELGLAAALHWLVNHQSVHAGFESRLDVDLGNVEIPSEIEMVCFRIAQEAVTNAIRHGEPQTLQMKLSVDPDELHLTIEDDGVGFDVGQSRLRAINGASIGIIGMHERASLVGGRVKIESNPGSGTRIAVRLPLS